MLRESSGPAADTMRNNGGIGPHCSPIQSVREHISSQERALKNFKSFKLPAGLLQQGRTEYIDLHSPTAGYGRKWGLAIQVPFIRHVTEIRLQGRSSVSLLPAGSAPYSD